MVDLKRFVGADIALPADMLCRATICHKPVVGAQRRILFALFLGDEGLASTSHLLLTSLMLRNELFLSLRPHCFVLLDDGAAVGGVSA